MEKDRLPGSKARREAEIRDEIEFYLEERARELEAEGVGRDEARRRARDAFGDVEKVAATVNAIHERDGRGGMGGERWAAWLRDVRHALRGLRRAPGYTAVALATLALGLGANTAIYSLVHASLFRAPPVESPDELIALYTTSRRGFPRSATSYPDYLDYLERATLLQDLAATSTLPASLGDDERGSRFLALEVVTGNYFPLLGSAPARGRLLGLDDDRSGAGQPVIVLSHRLFQGHFAGDDDVVGSAVRLNGRPFTVVGVAHPEFTGLSLGSAPDAWIPMQAASVLEQGAIANPDIWGDRGSRWMGMLVGRRVPGATTEQVRSQLAQISDGMKGEYGDLRGPRDTTVDDLSSYALPNGSEEQLTRFVWLLLGVVGFTLLLACANLANLLLTRATSRAREMAVRLAMGARRGHLVRQLLTESLVVSAVGGMLGLVVAVGLIRLLGPFALPGGIAVADLGATVRGPVLVFAAVAAVVTGLVFGLLPAMQATRPDLSSSLKAGAATGSRTGGHMLRKSLVGIQVALCLVLLIGSGLFVATLRNGMSHDVGFGTDGVAMARFNLGLLNYEPAEAEAFTRTLRGRLEQRPGIRSAAVSTRVPLLGGGARGFFFEVPGYQPRADEELRVDLVAISPGYFESLDVPLLAGRSILPSDVPGSGEVAVISRAMADTYWGGTSPVNRTVVLGDAELTVVGVVEDVTWQGIDDEATNFLYIPLAMAQDWAAGFVSVVARTAGDPNAVLETVRSEITALEPDAPVTVLTTMDAQVREVLTAQQMGAVLLTGFGALALLLASLGIGGVVSYTVQRRRRDIGIRMALGAARSSVTAQVAMDMALPVVVGTATGLLAASLLTRSVEGFLFGVSATDPATYAGISAFLLGVALIAAAVPARRATAVNPVEVLGAE